jgi:sulfide dehydrogenase cytochrome subunit
MTTRSIILATLLAWACCAQVQATTPNQARSWAAACANCHGTNGQAQPGMAALAGAPKNDIVQKMQEFKSGQRPATLMHQLAKGYSDEQIEAIAAYFAAQKK